MDLRIAVSCDALLTGLEPNGNPGPGTCFHFVDTVAKLIERNGGGVIVSVISRRSPIEGGRIVRALGDLGMNRATGFFSGGEDPMKYLHAISPDMYLGSDVADVQNAIAAGIPAAVMHGMRSAHVGEQLRVAFDGDGVLFDQRTEEFFQQNGIAAFLAHERDNATNPMEPGPLLPLLRALNQLRTICGPSILRTALVTARSGSACERPIRTLESLGVMVDEVLFCGDLGKTELLQAFGAHVFFDDSPRHVHPASEHMPSGHVPWRLPAA